MTITPPQPIQASIAAQLREKAVRFIEVNSLDDAAVAERLDVSPHTAHLLLSRPRWDMSVALSVAERLGVSLTIT